MEKLDSIKRVLEFYLKATESKKKQLIVKSIALAVGFSGSKDFDLAKVIRMITLIVFDKRTDLVNILGNNHQLVCEYDDSNKAESVESELALECLSYAPVLPMGCAINSNEAALKFYYNIIKPTDTSEKYEYIFDSIILAIIMSEEFNYDIDLANVVKMLILHKNNYCDGIVQSAARDYIIGKGDATFAIYCENLYFDLQLGLLNTRKIDYYDWQAIITEKYNNPDFSQFIDVLKVARYSDLSLRDFKLKDDYLEFTEEEYSSIAYRIMEICRVVCINGFDSFVNSIYVSSENGGIKVTIVLDDSKSIQSVIDCQNILRGKGLEKSVGQHIHFTDNLLSSYTDMSQVEEGLAEELLGAHIMYDKDQKLSKLVENYKEKLLIDQSSVIGYIPPFSEDWARSLNTGLIDKTLTNRRRSGGKMIYPISSQEEYFQTAFTGLGESYTPPSGKQL